MLSQQDGPFINLARLNIGKYSKRPNVAKALFEYIFYHENSMREAMELASQVSVISITQVLGVFFVCWSCSPPAAEYALAAECQF